MRWLIWEFFMGCALSRVSMPADVVSFSFYTECLHFGCIPLISLCGADRGIAQVALPQPQHHPPLPHTHTHPPPEYIQINMYRYALQENICLFFRNTNSCWQWGVLYDRLGKHVKIPLKAMFYKRLWFLEKQTVVRSQFGDTLQKRISRLGLPAGGIHVCVFPFPNIFCFFPKDKPLYRIAVKGRWGHGLSLSLSLPL